MSEAVNIKILPIKTMIWWTDITSCPAALQWCKHTGPPPGSRLLPNLRQHVWPVNLPVFYYLFFYTCTWKNRRIKNRQNTQDFCFWWMPEHDAATQLNLAPRRQEVTETTIWHLVTFQNKTLHVDTSTQILKRQTQALQVIPQSGTLSVVVL